MNNMNWLLGPKIGNGSFGEVFIGIDTVFGLKFAIKRESNRRRSRHQQLENEFWIYKLLEGGSGIPTAYRFETGIDYNSMVMQLLGHSLEYLFRLCDRIFSLKTVLMLADQLLSCIKYIHTYSVIHCDIKPQNILMGLERSKHEVNIIDFGLARMYYGPEMDSHHSYSQRKKSFRGTARYASINTHLGIQQSRRDDLESLGYVLIYFCQGSLPWDGLQDKTYNYQQIMEKKRTSADILCSKLPKEFATYLNYVRALDFHAMPDYEYLRSLFHDLYAREGFSCDGVYDWTTCNYSQMQSVT